MPPKTKKISDRGARATPQENVEWAVGRTEVSQCLSTALHTGPGQQKRKEPVLLCPVKCALTSRKSMPNSSVEEGCGVRGASKAGQHLLART